MRCVYSPGFRIALFLSSGLHEERWIYIPIAILTITESAQLFLSTDVAVYLTLDWLDFRLESQYIYNTKIGKALGNSSHCLHIVCDHQLCFPTVYARVDS